MHCAQKVYINVKDDFPDLKRIIIAFYAKFTSYKINKKGTIMEM